MFPFGCPYGKDLKGVHVRSFGNGQVSLVDPTDEYVAGRLDACGRLFVLGADDVVNVVDELPVVEFDLSFVLADLEDPALSTNPSISV